MYKASRQFIALLPEVLGRRKGRKEQGNEEDKVASVGFQGLEEHGCMGYEGCVMGFSGFQGRMQNVERQVPLNQWGRGGAPFDIFV